MFKLESYITPLLLSYVDKYIKNFRAEDSQVSLWGGDVSFNNLDLRLEVLENELQLPFTFVSGHIHELLIHVPWTKIRSEPITITINTIECILKLKGPEGTTVATPTVNEKKKKLTKRESVEAPPGYLQTVINKIVGNIRIYCNNLILKYVEEDIVLSMNVKLLTFESANQQWEPAYTDIPHGDVTLRKLIMIHDLTICLDKRNASGKIEVYQEPILYRCSMAIRLLRNYYSPTANKTSVTRSDIYCTSMEFSMNEQQVPMVMRIITLIMSLIKHEFKQDSENYCDTIAISTEDITDSNLSWAGWAWSIIPSIFPVQWDDESKQDVNLQGHTIHFGFFVDNVALTFKVSEYISDRGYYQQKKIKYWPVLNLNLQGMLFESISHGKAWANSTFGISEILVYPMGICTCSQSDIMDPENLKEYLKAGCFSQKHLLNSLFDPEAPENKNFKKKYNVSYEHHMRMKTEEALIDITPAISIDFIHNIQIPDDISLTDLSPTEEYLNFNEKHLLRVIIGPLRVNICSGFFHRLSTLKAAASTYDYHPYTKPKPLRSFQDLQPPTEDDFDALNERITMTEIRLTLIAPVIEIELMDHPYFEATKDNYFKPRKRLTATSSIYNVQKELPKLTLECQCIDAKFSYPYYENKVVVTTCQLPDPPENMFNACHKEKSVKVLGICSRLILGPNKKHTTLITPTNASYYTKSIIHPEYWLGNDILHETVIFESDAITITGTNPKLSVAFHILDKLFKMGVDEYYSYILNSSLFEDASRDFSMACIECSLEGVKYKKILTNSTQAYEIKVGSIKSFIFNPVDISVNLSADEYIYENHNCYSTHEIEQIMFISASETVDEEFDNLFTATIQLPLSPNHQLHPPVIIFNLREIKICFDPLFCKWLLYAPTVTLHKADITAESYQRKLKNPSDLSILETPRKAGTPRESVHSSSDREHIFKNNKPQCIKEEYSIDIQERIYNFLKSWFNVWKGLILFGDISQCIINFPIESLSAVGSRGIHETISQSMLGAEPPEILVITLPHATIRSNSQKQSIMNYINVLPIKLPEDIWNTDIYSFPWMISVNNFSVYTLQNRKKLYVLKSASMTATVGLTTNATKSTDEKSNSSMNSPTENINCQSSHSSIEIETLGICVHIDISPIDIFFSEVQVYLLSSILYGLTEVAFNLAAPLTIDNMKQRGVINHNNSTISPIIFCENSVESNSEHETFENQTIKTEDNDIQKLTAWIQTTITKLTITILTNRQDKKKAALYKEKPDLKLVFDAEDIVSSMDFQNVYLKLKSKIGSATIQHFERNKFHSGYSPGPFLGLVMKAREDTLSDIQDDTCFANITITRANCKHTHNLWGTLKKSKKDKDNVKVASETPSRFITEIVFTLQPIDFVLSPQVLSDYLLVFQPLTQITSTLKKSKKKYEHKFKINNTTLPLTYLEFKGFQFLIPISNTATIHDMCIIQIDNISLNPNPDNPICRTPCRSDIYEKAAQARLLHIPGSDVEDRQYQLELNGISLSTGKWKDFEGIQQNLTLWASVKTISENPALEWNNLSSKRVINSPHLRLWPFLGKFHTQIIAAPAMVYKNILVCNHSIEINFISDIELNVSLSHINLLSTLIDQMSAGLSHFYSSENLHPKVVFPYQTFYFLPATIFDDTDSIDTKDSGFDTYEIKSNMSYKDNVDNSRIHILSETEKLVRVVSKPMLFLHSEPKIPMEILITAGKVSFLVSQLLEENKMPHKHKLSKLLEKTKSFGKMKDEKNESVNRHFQPILFISLSQPNCYMSDTHLGQKLQITCFDICIKINETYIESTSTIPTESDFHVNVLETCNGEPDQHTGILPSLFTIKWAKGLTKVATLDIEFQKPTRILFSVDKCDYLLTVYESLRRAFSSATLKELVEEKSFDSISIIENKEKRLRFYDQYERFKDIKRKLRGIGFINFEISQIVVGIKTADNVEMNFSIGKLKHNLTVNNRPERMLISIQFEYLSLSIINETSSKLLLNPWSLSSEICLFWEPWQDEDSDPQIQVLIESDIMMFDISPLQIQHVSNFVTEMKDFISSHFKINPPLKTCINESNQYYKDDLRAGAFQFVDAETNNLNELPLPYQVMFWSRNASAMAWRYPQPRVLTKVRVFPVPFKVTTDEATTEQILCHLEYWSDSYNCYQPYVKFYLSESEMCHLELPITEPKPVIACTWRVLLTSTTAKDKNKSCSSTRVPISPHVLAGCIRIDSYFSKSLVPDLIVVMNISCINISFYNNLEKDEFYMPDCLKEYNCDLTLPEKQCFSTFHLKNIKAYLSSWNFESIMFETTSDISCSILDYSFLTNQTLIEPFNAKLTFSLSHETSINFISKPIRLRFGESAAHTLFVSAQLWNENWNNLNVGKELVIVTPYIICNNCNVPIRFGQTGYEEIYLPTRYCHLYAWRSQKCKKMIRVGIEDDNLWIWSEPFHIDREGTQMLRLSDKKITIILTVKALSATQRQVIFSGQFTIYNMLVEHLEFKIVEAVLLDKDKAFKKAQNYIINGKSSPPTILLATKKKYFLRLRFFGLESAWSGDIPLAENSRSAQPWLVKVPLQERGQFLSIWCKIIVQQFPKGSKTLAVLWPLFMIRSNLPVNSKIQIETPTLNVRLESTIKGQGEHQQLYCPGTIDHSHQITLQLDDSVPTLNPYVPLNYSLVDQRLFFKKTSHESIDEVMDILKKFDHSEWPYFDENLDASDYRVDDQPLTHVQVKYENACQYSSTLLVELLPWCLLLNTLGCQIGIIINGKEICRVDHYGVVTPPKLEETFHIGVGLGKTWNMSLPLQLAKSDWGQVFYMPKITGTIPLEGHIKSAVKCGAYICMLSLISCIKNEIRLLKISSTHVVTNHLNTEMYVVCFAVLDTEEVYDIPANLDKHCFAIPPIIDKEDTGVSIVQWYAIGKNIDITESQSDFALYVAFAANPKLDWSCPVRVDKGLIRRSIAVQTHNSLTLPMVITANELDGQHLISLHHDRRPQIKIQNCSGIKLFFAQCQQLEKTVIDDCAHFKWICCVDNNAINYYTLPLLSENFPEIQTINVNEYLVIASDPEGDPQGFQWSNPVNLTITEQFVRIPFFGDVKIITNNASHTLTLLIESVAQAEINAQDIRVRLSQHENDVLSAENSEDSIGQMVECSSSNFFLKGSSSSSTVSSSYHTAEDIQSIEIHSPINTRALSTVFEVDTSFNDNESSIKSPLSLDAYNITNKFKMEIFLQSIIFTLTSDLENGGIERTEIATLTCESVALQMHQKQTSKLCFYVSEIQLDNQLYQSGLYDFSVVLIGQEVKEIDSDISIHTPIRNLFDKTNKTPLLKVEVNYETWRDNILNKYVTDLKDVKINIMPLAAYIEDIYSMKLLEHLATLSPTNLIHWSNPKRNKVLLNNAMVKVPKDSILLSTMIANPLILSSLIIEPLNLSLSVHSSKKMYIALDQSPLQFALFERKGIMTTPYRMGHTLTMHYLSGAIFGAGWVVGSLELLGSPGGFARAMGSGLKDFVSMPCYGLIQGPWAFVKGVTHGSASLMKHITAGTLQSVTKLASSVARNLDRLTLDEEHLRRTEEQRRQKPQGLAQGFLQGLTGLGISLLGAIGGIAHHPLQSIVTDGPSTSNLIAGVGLGIVGMFTKPLSGAADLVALTGQGLLQGAGWNPLPQPRMNPISIHMYSSQNTLLKYCWKYALSTSSSEVIFATEATCIANGQYESVALILTLDNLVIANIDEDMPQRTLKLSELSSSDINVDPTLLTLKLKLPVVEDNREVNDDDDIILEMNPTSRARVADYVRSTFGFLHFPERLTDTDDDNASSHIELNENTEQILTFYVNPHNKNYFLCLLNICKLQQMKYHFPIF